MSIRLLAWILCLPVMASSQKTDSLRTLLEQASGPRRPNLEAHLAFAFVESGRYDSAIVHYQRVLSSPQANIALRASAMNSLAIAYNELGIVSDALLYYRQALELYESLNDTVNTPIIETNLSILYKDQGLYDEALEHAFEAIAREERQHHQERALASTYNTVSLIYYKTGGLEDALKFAYKSLRLRIKINNVKLIAQSYNTLGEIYTDRKEYDSAQQCLLRALEIKRANNDRKAISSTLNNLGTIMLQLHQPQIAARYFTESLTLKREFKDRNGEAIALNNLARVRLEETNLSEAARYLHDAENILHETGALQELRTNIELQIQLNRTRKNYPEALRLTDHLLAIRDSLMTAEKAESLMTLQLRYDIGGKEQQIEFLQRQDNLKSAEINAKQNLIYALATVLVLLLAVAVLVYNNFRLTKKGKKSVELLLSELHHRVKNNLQLLSSILSLQSRELTDVNALHAVKSNESRVNAMALIHRKLYIGYQQRSINIQEYITELVQYLVHTYGYAQKEFKLDLQVEAIQLDVDKAIPLGLIINEVISNSFKYAFAQQEHPVLNVALELRNQRELFVQLHDNGAGFTPGPETGSGAFGMKMIDTLMRELKGKLDLETHNGTTYHLHIPIY